MLATKGIEQLCVGLSSVDATGANLEKELQGRRVQTPEKKNFAASSASNQYVLDEVAQSITFCNISVP